MTKIYIRSIFSLIGLMFFLSCKNDVSGLKVYQLTEDIQALWDKESGMLEFYGKLSGKSVKYNFRKAPDSLFTLKERSKFHIRLTGDYKFQLIEDDKPLGQELKFQRKIHVGIQAEVTYNPLPESPFGEENVTKVNDGISGDNDVDNKEWVGWKTPTAVIEYDFKKDQYINSISFRYRDFVEYGYYPPKHIIMEGSTDGVKFTELINRRIDAPGYFITEEQISVRGTFKKIRFTIFNYNEDSAKEIWMMTDEIIILEY